MDTQDPPTGHLASAQYWAGLAGGDTGRLFLTFGGPVRADRKSYCPLDRVLTYKNLIYLLNLQVFLLINIMGNCNKQCKLDSKVVISLVCSLSLVMCSYF